MESAEEDFALSDSESEGELDSEDEFVEAADPVECESNFCIEQEFSSESFEYPELLPDEEDFIPVPNAGFFPGKEICAIFRFVFCRKGRNGSDSGFCFCFNF